MSSTITEKIIAAHAGHETVQPGSLVEVDVDLALANDITAPLAIEVFRSAGVGRVHAPDKIALVPDHFVPNKDIKSAELVQLTRNFAREQEIEHFFDLDEMGVEHALLPEAGLVLPGDMIIGADSHTCTYGGLGAFATGMGSTDIAGVFLTGRTWLKVPESMKFVYKGTLGPWVGGKDLILMTIGDIGVDGALYRAMEFCGPVIDGLDMDGRLTMCNMAVEAGAKNGVIAPDEVTRRYVEGRAKRPFKEYQSDPDARYLEVREYDVTGLEPQVARPHLPENVVGVSELKDVVVDQSVIGSCTNGRIEDIRLAAKVLEGRRIKPGFRLIVIPATREVYRQALTEGLLETFLSAGAVISTPTCGPCLGGYMGILAPGKGRFPPPTATLSAEWAIRPVKFIWPTRPWPPLPPWPAASSARTICKEGAVKYQGKAFVFGQDVDTDAIIPARYLNTTDAAELARHCMEDADPKFAAKVSSGDIIVAGKNFGCGSSREHAPVAIKAAGVPVVVAASFARIFYRNSFNTGLLLVESPEAAAHIKDGDEIEVDVEAGLVSRPATGDRFAFTPIPPFMLELAADGGLIPHLMKKRGA